MVNIFKLIFGKKKLERKIHFIIYFESLNIAARFIFEFKVNQTYNKNKCEHILFNRQTQILK